MIYKELIGNVLHETFLLDSAQFYLQIQFSDLYIDVESIHINRLFYNKKIQ